MKLKKKSEDKFVGISIGELLPRWPLLLFLCTTFSMISLSQKASSSTEFSLNQAAVQSEKASEVGNKEVSESTENEGFGSKFQDPPNKAYSLLAADEAKEWEAKRTSSRKSDQVNPEGKGQINSPDAQTSKESRSEVFDKSIKVYPEHSSETTLAQTSSDSTLETLDQGPAGERSRLDNNEKKGSQKPSGQTSDGAKEGARKSTHHRKKVSGATKSDKSDQASKHAPGSAFLTYPDWGVGEFDYFVNPIIGFASQRLDYPGYSRYVAVGEIGANLGLDDVPVAAGNPGLTLGASVGSTMGSYQVAEGKNVDWKASSSRYRRTFGAATFSIYRGFFKDEISLSRGLIAYSNADWKSTNLQSAGISNDAGWRLNSALSVHYRLGLEKAWSQKFSDANLTVWDHWVYGRLQYSPIKFRSDFGPGYQVMTQKTSLDVFSSSSQQEINSDLKTSVSMPYLKLVFQINPFWKLVAVSTSKWNLSSKTTISSSTGQRLPQESIYDTKEVGLPGDSLSSGNFVGLAQLLGGLSVGYQVNLTITQMSDSAKRQTKRTSGLALSYQVSL